MKVPETGLLVLIAEGVFVVLLSLPTTFPFLSDLNNTLWFWFFFLSIFAILFCYVGAKSIIEKHYVVGVLFLMLCILNVFAVFLSLFVVPLGR